MEIKHAGPPQASITSDRVTVVSWRLSGQPDRNWVTLFCQPDSFDSAHHPKRIQFIGNTAQLTCSPDGIDGYVDWFDKWAEMANRKYADLQAETAKQSREAESGARRGRAA